MPNDDELDPAIAAEVFRAERELTRRLHADSWRAQDRPVAFAADFIRALLAEGWRVPLRPAPSWRMQRHRPPGRQTPEYLRERERWRSPTREDRQNDEP